MMWSNRTSLARIGFALSLSCLAAGAQAQGAGYGYASSHGAYGDRPYGYGFAEPAIRGDYIGTPFTRIPRPSDIVPSVWGYGTYGVPTMTGIRSAPVGVPTIYVIDGPSRAGTGAARRDGQWSQGEMRREPMRDQVSGARVIAVTVPRR